MAEPSQTASRAGHRRVRRPGAQAALGIVPGTLRPRSDLLRSTALQAVFLAALVVPAARTSAQPAPTALPSGGQVIAGQARITTNTGAGTAAMTVKQSTAYGAYDWKSFDIGKSASVTYQVPTSQSVSVNRVISPTSPSVIAGKLTSNGVVVVQNQSGVVFTQGAEVNVNTLIASAPGISDANARAGRLVFDQPARPGAKVENHGTITVAQTGLAALVAPQVANSGVIRAQMGRVVLAGAEAHTVDLYGDGLLSIDVTKQVTKVATGTDGKAATALVTNTGTIIADGGTILLTASAVDGLVETLVTSGGTLRANTAGATTGQVALKAKGGNVVVAGTIAATGATAGSKGGQVEINAPSRTVTLTPTARVDVSGKAGGGTAAIGTTLARAKAGPALKAPTARNVIIESGARVAADATLNGTGGNVTILSQGGTTRHMGDLSARGGPQGGNGGFIEVSGDTLSLGGRADVTAPAGTIGAILLDPIDLVISDAETTKGSDAPTKAADSITTKAGDGTTNLKASDILLLAGNITIEAIGTLTINAAIDTSATGTIGDVTFKSGKTLTVNAPVTVAGTKTLALTSGGNIALAANLTAGTIDLTAASGGVLQSSGSLAATTLLSSGGITGTLSLTSATNSLATLGKISVTGGDLLLANATALDIAGAITLDAGKTTSLALPGLTAGTGSVATGTFELAPLSDTMSLGAATASELVLTQATLAKITADTLRLGAAGAGKATATTVALNDALDTSTIATTRLVAGAGGIALTKGTLKAATLDITTAGGGIADAGGAITATTLQGTGITGAVALGTSDHAIATLGTLTVSGGGLNLRNTIALKVAGPVTLGGDSTLASTAASAKAIEVTGSLTLSANGKSLSLAAPATGGITLAGTVDTTATGTLNLTSGSLGVSQTGGIVTAGTLASTGGSAGTITLGQAGNAISAVGNVAVTGGNLVITTGTAVTVGGIVSADNVTITGSAASATAISVPGSITANGGTGAVILSATDASKGGIALSGTITASKGSIDLSAGAGGILQSGGSLASPLLASTGGIGASATLGSADNAIGATGAIKVSAGDLLLATKSTLDITGTLAIDATRTLSLRPLGLKISTGALSAAGGTVEIAPLDGATMSLGKAVAAELAISTADLAKISSATLRLGGTAASATVADSLVVRDAFDATTAATAVLRLDAGASGITIDSAAILKANTLDLNAVASGVNGIAGASITANRLQSTAGITGDAALANSVHSIGTLGDMKVAGTLALATGIALDISGKVTTKGASISSAAADAKAIAVTGQITGEAGTTLALKAADAAGGIAVTGVLDASSLGTLDVTAGTAGIIQTAGTVAAGLLSGSTTGGLAFAGADNQFSAIGKLTAGGDVKITSTVATIVSGPLSAANISLSGGAAGGKALDVTGTIKATGTAFLSATDNAGGIAISGTIDAAVIDLNAGTGGITQSGGALVSPLLQSSGDSGGSVVLAAPGNAITTLGSFVVGDASDFSLASSTPLKVDGPVKSVSGNITLVTTAPGTLDIAGPVLTSKATIALRATNAAGAVKLGANVGTPGGTIDLVAGSGGVTQVAGTLEALRLVSSAGIGGKVSLLSAGNALLGIGDLAVTSGDMTLVNAGPLTVAGTLALTAGTLLLDVTDPTVGGLSVPGVITGQDVTLIGRGAAGAVAIGGTVAATGTLDLSVTGGGGVAAPGTITAGTLRSSLGTIGAFTANGTENNIATVGGISAKGGDISLATKAGTGFTLAGTLAVDAGKSVGITADSFTITTGAISAPSGTVEIRAATAGISLGAASPGELSLLQTDLAAITADALRLASNKGAITLRANLDTTTAAPAQLHLDAATGINLTAGALGATTVEVAAAAGGVTQTAGLLAAKTVTTGAGTIAGPITLDNAANTISQTGPLRATGAISIASSVALSIADGIKAPAITLASGAAGPALNLPATGSLLATSPGTIALATTNAAGTSTLAGTIDTLAGGTLLLSGGGSISQTGGQVSAGTLATTGTIGGAALGQATNTIATLGPFAATGDLALTTTQALSSASTVSAANITLGSSAASTGAITISSTDFTTAAGGTIALSATNAAGGIALSGTLSASPTGILDLATGTAGIAQSAGSLTAGTLRSTAGIGGSVSLSQANGISALGPLAAKGGITLASGKSIAVAAPVSAGTGTTLSLAAPGMTFAGTGALTATGGTVEIGPTTASRTFALGTATGDFALGTLGNVSASLVRIGQASSAGNANKAASITLADAVTPTATTLELVTSGAITQTKGGLVVPILTAKAATLNLSQPGNAIGTLGAITITGDLAIANDSPITVSGALAAANITLRSAAASATALDISGTLATAPGGTITLAATDAVGGIAVSGKLDATGTGTIDLASGSGGITQSAGTLTAALLRSTGGATGNLTLDQAANAIATLGDITIVGGALTLRSSLALDITGAVAVDALALRSAGATLNLTATGSVVASGTALLAATSGTGGIGLAGTAKAATLDLSAGSAGITQTGGTLTAGILTSTGGSGGAVVLDQAGNSIAALGPFSVPSANLTLVDAAALTVTGPVAAANITLKSSAASTKAIDITGSLTANSGGTISLSATNATGGIALSGTLGASAGTIDLSSGSGGIAQSAGSITATTLRSTTGASGAVALFQPANKIASLSDFAVTGAGFSLSTSQALAVPGTVKAADITLESSAAGAAITLTGALSAPGGTLALTAANSGGGLSLGGTASADQVNITAGTAGIVQPAGSISAATLRAKVTGGDATLDRPGNSIATLGDTSIAGGALVLVDNVPLTAAGTIGANAITLVNTAPGTAITVTGALASTPGGTIALTAGNATGAIDLAGTINATATGTLDLTAGANIGQSAGSITAGTLRSTGKIGGDLALTNAANAIGRITTLAVAGTASIADSIALDIAGPLSAANLSLTSSAAGTAISVTGTASATGTMTLAATDPTGGIALSGTVSAALLDLSAGTAGVSQTAGTLSAATLRSTAGVSGVTTLDQAANAITSLADFAVTGGGFTLRSATALDIAGNLSADAIALRGSAASAKALAVSGSVSAAGTALLAATSATGGIALSGNVQAATLDLSAGSAGITQSAGTIKATTLKSTGGSAGTVSLGQTTNGIATLGDFALSGGTFTLADATALTIAGTVKADSVVITGLSGGTAIAVPGTIATKAGGTITLAAANATGGITLSGNFDATPTGTIDLSAGSGGISQTAGSLIAGLLRSTGGASGQVALTQTGNAISTLGNFEVQGAAFSLFNSIALSVTGPVSATAITLDSAAAGTAVSLTGNLAAPGGNVTLKASGTKGGLSLAGTVTADQLDLVAGSGGIVQPGGSIAAATLRAMASGNATLDRPGNSIAVLGPTTITNGAFTLVDSIPLTAAGPVKADAIALTNSAAGVAIVTTGNLATSPGGTIALAATNPASAIDLAATLDATAKGIVDLSAGAGITQSGGNIIAGTLRSTGGIGGSLTLAQPNNAVATVTDLKVAGTATFVDSISLTLAGPITAADLTITGTSAGTAISLTGTASATNAITLLASDPTGGIALSGTATAALLDLGAGTGGITQSAGSLSAGTLRSTSGSSGAVSLPQVSNKIATIDNFSVGSKLFALTSASPLTINGTLTAPSIDLTSTAAGTAITVAPAASLNANGSLKDGTGFLSLAATNAAGGMALNGNVKAATLDLATGTGGITQGGGSITASTMRSSNGVTGAVALLQPANAIATILKFHVSDGDFALRNAVGLNVDNLAARNVDLRTLAEGITVSNGITAAKGGLIHLDAAGAISLGNLNASATGIIDLNAGAGIVQFGSGGATLIAGTLRSTSGVTGNVSLIGNSIGKIADFAVTGGSFTYGGFVPLTVAGTLSATDVTLMNDHASAAALNITGTVRTGPGRTMALAALSPAGGITLAGTVDATATGLLDLQAGAGGVTQSAGTITANRLQSNNGVGGSVALNQPSNSIDILGTFTVKGGSLSLTDSLALTVLGPVTISGGNLALASTAPAVAINLAGPTTVSGTATLSTPDPTAGIVLNSTLSAATLDLATGAAGVTQAGGTATIGTLQGSGVKGSLTLAQPTNSIAKVGTLLLESGDATLVSSTPITVAGSLKALQGDIAITGFAAGPAAIDITGKVVSGPGRTTSLGSAIGGVTIGGSVAAPGGLLLLPTATGVTAPGVLVADRLAASATKAGDIALAGPNGIGTLVGAILANGNFLLNNAAPLTVSGPVTARVLGITAAGSLKLSDGVTITTDGKPRTDQGVSNTLTPTQIAALVTPDLGSYLAVTSSFGAPGKIDIGKITVAPFSVSQATLDFVLPHPAAGTITIGQLTGPATDLILVTRSGGIATGTIDVANLLVVGTGGKADLFGKIGGIDGQAAANRASISPQPDSDYRFNACPITSVNCVLIPIQTVPPISPLRDVPIIRDRPTQDDTDVQLPNVSEEDY